MLYEKARATGTIPLCNVRLVLSIVPNTPRNDTRTCDLRELAAKSSEYGCRHAFGTEDNLEAGTLLGGNDECARLIVKCI